MPGAWEVLLVSLFITQAWVLIVLSIRVRRLEHVTHTPLSAQIGRLQDKVRRLQSDNELHVQRRGRTLYELDTAITRLENDLRVLAERVDRPGDVVMERLRQEEQSTLEDELSIGVYAEGDDDDVLHNVVKHVEELAEHLGYGHSVRVG